MCNPKPQVLFFLIYTLSINLASAQSHLHNDILPWKAFEKWSTLYAQEKAYLHTDRSAYFKGDTIGLRRI